MGAVVDDGALPHPVFPWSLTSPAISLKPGVGWALCLRFTVYGLLSPTTYNPQPKPKAYCLPLIAHRFSVYTANRTILTDNRFGPRAACVLMQQSPLTESAVMFRLTQRASLTAYKVANGRKDSAM